MLRVTTFIRHVLVVLEYCTYFGKLFATLTVSYFDQKETPAMQQHSPICLYLQWGCHWHSTQQVQLYKECVLSSGPFTGVVSVEDILGLEQLNTGVICKATMGASTLKNNF